MQYGCRGESWQHCQSQGLDQCEYCAWYERGHGLPHYPVPAIPVNVVLFGDDYMYDTMYIEELTVDVDGQWCPDHIVCLWDWNWDRNEDFGTPHGEMQMFFHDRLKGTTKC